MSQWYSRDYSLRSRDTMQFQSSYLIMYTGFSDGYRSSDPVNPVHRFHASDNPSSASKIPKQLHSQRFTSTISRFVKLVTASRKRCEQWTVRPSLATSVWACEKASLKLITTGPDLSPAFRFQLFKYIGTNFFVLCTLKISLDSKLLFFFFQISLYIIFVFFRITFYSVYELKNEISKKLRVYRNRETKKL